MSFRRSIWLGGSLAGAALALTLGALAQQGPQEPAREENKKDGLTDDEVAAARFLEACTAGEWTKADQAHRELVARWPAYSKKTTIAYRHCEVLVRLGRKTEAASELKDVLALEEDNVSALSLLATIELGEEDPALKAAKRESAKERLLHAARNGFFVLREISSAKGKEFDQLREDPAFVLACMKASHEFDASHDLAGGPGRTPVRNPFDIPLVGFPKEAQPASSESARPPAAPAKPQDPATLLEALVNAGNECLRAIAVAIREERFEDARRELDKLDAIVADLKKIGTEESNRYAAAFHERRTMLGARVEKYERIKKLRLEVTGIVVDPRPAGRNRGVIVFDDPERRGRVYEVGDEIRDRDDRRVSGLKVVAITEGAVRFQLDDLDFVRQLKEPSKG